jgi:hypothetical protein
MEVARNISWIYFDFKRLRKVICFFSRPYASAGIQERGASRIIELVFLPLSGRSGTLRILNTVDDLAFFKLKK